MTHVRSFLRQEGYLALAFKVFPLSLLAFSDVLLQSRESISSTDLVIYVIQFNLRLFPLVCSDMEGDFWPRYCAEWEGSTLAKVVWQERDRVH